MGNIKDGMTERYKSKIFMIIFFMLFMISNTIGCSKQVNERNMNIPTGEKNKVFIIMLMK